MTMTAKVMMTVVLCAAVSAAGAVVADRRATNIAPNPGAEKAGAENLPEGWSQYRNTPAEAGTTDRIRHSGKRSAYVKITNFRDDDYVNTGLAVGLTTGWMTGSDKAIPVKPNTKYYFSFYVKGEGFTRKMGVRPWCFKTDGSGRDQSIAGVQLIPTDKWTHYVGSFTTKAQTGRLVLMFQFYGKKDVNVRPGATFYIDDVYLGTSEADAKAEVPAAPQPKPTTLPAAAAGYSPLKPGTVRIWDTNTTYIQKRPAGAAIKDKAKWSLVPYGKTDYRPRGDLMLENDNFYLFLFTNKEDSISLLAKMVDRKGGGVADNEIYKVHDTGLRNFGGGTTGTPKILKYTAKEAIVEHAGLGMRTGKARPITTTYRVQGGKCWLEVRPVKWVNQQGMHGKSRLCAFVNGKSDEFVLDGKRVTWPGGSKNIHARPDTIGIINFARRYRQYTYDFMWFLTGPPGFEKSKLTYLGLHADRFWEDEIPHDRPSCGAQYAYMKDKVIIGVLNHKDVWKREDVLKPITAGGTYTSQFKAPYPGKWRLIGFVVQEADYKPRPRVPSLPIPESFKTPINGKYHFSTVEIKTAGEPFTFKSPAAGTLDYLLMYLNKRTRNTPPDVFTPMEVYRQAILGKPAGKSGPDRQ